jgi:hypothetical protein
MYHASTTCLEVVVGQRGMYLLSIEMSGAVQIALLSLVRTLQVEQCCSLTATGVQCTYFVVFCADWFGLRHPALKRTTACVCLLACLLCGFDSAYVGGCESHGV